MVDGLFVLIFFTVGFLIGFGAYFYQVKKNVKEGLIPVIDGAGSLSWARKE